MGTICFSMHGGLYVDVVAEQAIPMYLMQVQTSLLLCL